MTLIFAFPLSFVPLFSMFFLCPLFHHCIFSLHTLTSWLTELVLLTIPLILLTISAVLLAVSKVLLTTTFVLSKLRHLPFCLIH
jgi:hypothetical protein